MDYPLSHYNRVEALDNLGYIPSMWVKEIMLQVNVNKYYEVQTMRVVAQFLQNIRTLVRENNRVLILNMMSTPYLILCLTVAVGDGGKVFVLHGDQESVHRLMSHQPGFNVNRIQNIILDNQNGYPPGITYDFILANLVSRKVPEHFLERLNDGGSMLVKLSSIEFLIKKEVNHSYNYSSEGSFGVSTFFRGARHDFSYKELRPLKLRASLFRFTWDDWCQIPQASSIRTVEYLRQSHEREEAELARRNEEPIPDEQFTGEPIPDGQLTEEQARSLIPECMVCLEPMRPPTGICEYGHSVCVNCRAVIQSCPECRTPDVGKPNLVLDEILRILRQSLN